jgi:hypothetical protein
VIQVEGERKRSQQAAAVTKARNDTLIEPPSASRSPALQGPALVAETDMDGCG